MLPESDLLKTSATIVPYVHFWFASMRTGVSPQSDAYFSRLPMHVNPRGITKIQFIRNVHPSHAKPLVMKGKKNEHIAAEWREFIIF